LLPGGCLQRDAKYGRMRVRPFAEGGCHRNIVLCNAEEAMISPAAAKTMSLAVEAVHDLVQQGHWLGGRID
jgi:LysR family nitrogen assimilation transcriptional regulator